MSRPQKTFWAVTAIAMLILIIALLIRSLYGRADNSYKIAIFQSSSHPCMEEAIKGFESKLKQNDLYCDRKIVLNYFNPEQSPALRKAMVQKILSGEYDMVATFSTPALQTIAKYNTKGLIPHVFGVVNDPYSAGVGISRKNNWQPPHITGLSTPPPVRRIFRLARLCNPSLTMAGTIVNPDDSSSMVCLKKARDICRQLNIKLEVANVSSSIEVKSAAQQLLKKGVEAVFVGGDNTIDQCIGTISKVFATDGIPIFAYIPSHTADGAVIGLGASYFDIGRLMATIAIKVINGQSPADIPVRNIMPLILAVNLKTAKNLNANWKIPQKILDTASIILKGNESDDLTSLGFSHPASEVRNTLSASNERKRLFYINYNYKYPVEETINGFLAGMKRHGMVLGRNYELQIVNADRNPQRLQLLFKKANDNPNCDIILLTSSPALITALKTVPEKPVVFSAVAAPVAAGAGISNTSHRKNITGVSCMNNFQRMVMLIKQCFPNAKRIGTLYNPSEKDSELYMNTFKKRLEAADLQLLAIPNNSVNRSQMAIDKLVHSKVDVICQLDDHLHQILFPAISSAARTAHIPLLGFLSSDARKNGAILALVPNFEDGGRMQAKLVMQIIRGISPENLPFLQIKHSRLIINRKNAIFFNVKIPRNLLTEADMVID